MRIIEYFEQTKELQKYLREQIVQGDWRAAKFLYEVLEAGQLKEQYGKSTRLLLLVEDGSDTGAESFRPMSGTNASEGVYLLEPVAFCTLAERDEIVPEEMTPDMKPWIGFVYTFPTHRGHRYSEKLIDCACELARKDGYEKIYISSNEVGLYEKYGFVFLKMLHTVWGEETQVFEKQIKDEDLSCRCNEEKGG